MALPGAAHAAPGTSGEWGFDESSGQVVRDTGPFGLHGLLGTSAAADASDPVRIPGATGGALRFDGTSRVTLPGSARLEPRTLAIDAVVRAPRSPGAYRYVVSGGGDGCWSGAYGLYTAPAGGLAFYIYDGRHYVLTATARAADVWDGAWHSVTGVYDGSRLRLFVDGREVGDPMPAPRRIEYDLPSRRTTIGAYAGVCDLGFAGDVDLVRLRSEIVEKPGNTVTLEPPPTVPGEPHPPAPSGQAPLAPAARGMTLPAESRPSARCFVSLSRTRIAPRRRAVVQVRATGAGGRSVTVHRGRKKVSSTKLRGSRPARLVVPAQRAGTLTVRVAGCASATLAVRTKG